MRGGTNRREVGGPAPPLAAGATTDVLLSPDLIAGSFGMSAGPLSLTLAGSTSVDNELRLTTDFGGAIVAWEASIYTNQDYSATNNNAFVVTCKNPAIQTISCLTDRSVDYAAFHVIVSAESAIIEGSPGTWSVVPEPTTLSLSAIGLSAIGALRRARREAV